MSLKIKKLQIDYQRWKSCNTCQTQGIMDIKRPDTTSSATFQERIVIHINNMHISISTRRWRTRLELNMDNGATEGLMSWKTSCVSYHMAVMMELGKVKEKRGVLLGLLQVCVQFKVLSYRDCRRAVSGCVSGVEYEYLFCNFSPHLTDTQA